MRETLIRTLSGLIYILLLLTAILITENGISFIILFGIFLLIAVVEFCNLTHLSKTLPIAIALVFYTLFSFYTSFDATTTLLIVAASLFVSVKLLYFLFDNRPQKTDQLSKFVNLIGYIVLPITLITKLPFINSVYTPGIIIGIFILMWTNDTFAYIVGKSIGKRKLFERISPKKTMEGFFGGIIFTLLFSFIIAHYLNQPNYIWMATALIISIFGTFGDLIESKFKRIAGVKDSGKIMPGHGGILDRLDSIIFVSPILFLFYQIINYVS